MLYVEILRNGCTSVAEFHYFHHDEKGQRYANLSELGERLISAAKKSRYSYYVDTYILSKRRV